MAVNMLVCSVLSTEQHGVTWKMAVAAKSLEKLPCHHCTLMQRLPEAEMPLANSHLMGGFSW